VEGGRGILTVDMGCARTRVCVEFDGPKHYVLDVNTGCCALDGKTLWKSDALRALGWLVLRVGHGTWDMAVGRKQQTLVDSLLTQMRLRADAIALSEQN